MTTPTLPEALYNTMTAHIPLRAAGDFDTLVDNTYWLALAHAAQQAIAINPDQDEVAFRLFQADRPDQNLSKDYDWLWTPTPVQKRWRAYAATALAHVGGIPDLIAELAKVNIDARPVQMDDGTTVAVYDFDLDEDTPLVFVATKDGAAVYESRWWAAGGSELFRIESSGLQGVVAAARLVLGGSN